jgi:hypothetical protein
VKQQMTGQRSNKPLTVSEYEQLKGNIDQYLDSEGGVNIEPSAGIVIKGFEQDSK